MRNLKKNKKEFQFALQQSLPVFLGYIFLGMAFGLMLENAGYHFLWAFVASLFIYAGSMQFVLVTLLTGGASLWNTMIMTLFINGRHIFYGLSFVDKFKNYGPFCPYMIFSLTDETYSVLCDLKIPEGLNEKKVSFFIALLNHLYWITGSVVGALAGEVLSFDIRGIEFSMTALFLVIVINQWMERKDHKPAIIGFFAGIFFLLILGPKHFILPSLSFSMLLLLLLGYRKTEGGEKI